MRARDRLTYFLTDDAVYPLYALVVSVAIPVGLIGLARWMGVL